MQLSSFSPPLPFFPLIWPHAFSSNRKPPALEHAAMTFVCHLQMCWGGLLLMQKIWWEVCPTLLPGGLCEGTTLDVLKLPPLNWPCRKDKKDPGVKLCFRPLKERWGMGQERNRRTGPRHARPWLCWARNCFFLLCDPSTAELSDTSSAVLTRRCRALIEVGLSHPCSPMILFSMGQWEVGGTPLSMRHWWDCYLPSAAPLRGC